MAESAPGKPVLAHRLLQASTRLTGRAAAIFDGLFIKGLPEDSVRSELAMTPEQFSRERVSMLRSLMFTLR
jgi:hypothetical protein